MKNRFLLLMVMTFLAIPMIPGFAESSVVSDALIAKPYTFSGYTLTFDSYKSYTEIGGAGSATVKWKEQRGKSLIENSETCLYWLYNSVFIRLEFQDGFDFETGFDGNLYQVIPLDKPIILERSK